MLAMQSVSPTCEPSIAPVSIWQQNEVAQSGVVLEFAANSEIFAEGDACRSLYKVVSGGVRTCRFLSDGHRQIYGFYIAGDVFGFEPDSQHRLTAEAIDNCTVIAYRRTVLEKLAAQDAGISQQVYGQAIECLRRTMDHSYLLVFRAAVQKVAAFLLDLVNRANAVALDLAMTRQDIADYLGVTIETVSRTLTQMERDGLISRPTPRRIVVLNREGLEHLGG